MYHFFCGRPSFSLARTRLSDNSLYLLDADLAVSCVENVRRCITLSPFFHSVLLEFCRLTEQRFFSTQRAHLMGEDSQASTALAALSTLAALTLAAPSTLSAPLASALPLETIRDQESNSTKLYHGLGQGPQAIPIQFNKIIVLQSVTAQGLCQLRDHDIVFYYLVAAYAQNTKMERISMVACRHKTSIRSLRLRTLWKTSPN